MSGAGGGGGGVGRLSGEEVASEGERPRCIVGGGGGGGGGHAPRFPVYMTRSRARVGQAGLRRAFPRGSGGGAQRGALA